MPETSKNNRDPKTDANNSGMKTVGSELLNIVFKGKIISVDQETRNQLLKNVKLLLSSCQDRYKRRVTADDWDELIKSHSYVHTAYSTPIIIDTSVREGLLFTEILVPIDGGSWKNQIIVRNKETMYSPFAKYDSEIMDKIILLIGGDLIGKNHLINRLKRYFRTT